MSGNRRNVPTGAIDPKKRYSVQVHVDVNGSGHVTKGDYVSTSSYPVLTAGSPDDPTVTIRRV
jgi:hypothetical protein